MNQFKCNLLKVMLGPVIISGLTVETGHEMVLTSENEIQDMIKVILKVLKDLKNEEKKALYLCSILNTRIVDSQDIVIAWTRFHSDGV